MQTLTPHSTGTPTRTREFLLELENLLVYSTCSTCTAVFVVVFHSSETLLTPVEDYEYRTYHNSYWYLVYAHLYVAQSSGMHRYYIIRRCHVPRHVLPVFLAKYEYVQYVLGTRYMYHTRISIVSGTSTYVRKIPQQQCRDCLHAIVSPPVGTLTLPSGASRPSS